tara:strand:+ start:168 stop:710 length:543 start_codon:yes stop_codon:yes gene_type:complete
MANQGNFWVNVLNEPKRKNRFSLTLGDLPSWSIKALNKPTFNINVIEHDYLDYKFKFPGRVTWDAITVTVVDPAMADNENSAKLYQYLSDAGWVAPDSTAGAESAKMITKARATKLPGATSQQYAIITQMDADGKNLEAWTLYNAFITKVNFGALEYSSDDLVEVALDLAYDYAKYETFV